jgi:hypothetical protein
MAIEKILGVKIDTERKNIAIDFSPRRNNPFAAMYLYAERSIRAVRGKAPIPEVLRIVAPEINNYIPLHEKFSVAPNMLYPTLNETELRREVMTAWKRIGREATMEYLDRLNLARQGRLVN